MISVSPSVGNGLKQLLSFDGDVEETFAVNFNLAYSIFGETKTVELKKNGSSIPVNNQNRREYVELYVDYMLTNQSSNNTRHLRKAFYWYVGEIHSSCFGTRNWNC